MRLRLPERDDRGVTLVELLVTVTLLVIIIVPLTNAMITYLRNTKATNDRLAVSHDAQIATAYFAQDVQSLGLHDWGADGFPLKLSSVEEPGPVASGNQCRLASPETTPDAVIRMSWDAPATATTVETVVVSYVVKQVGSEKQLWRLRCNGGGTVVDRAVVAHNLDTTPDARCFSLSGTEQQCSGASTVPFSISMDLTIRVSGSTDTLTVKLFGQRRQTQS
jgi:prepilin-type N-terminal cleavage/methylation domain-containing protein